MKDKLEQKTKGYTTQLEAFSHIPWLITLKYGPIFVENQHIIGVVTANHFYFSQDFQVADLNVSFLPYKTIYLYFFL